MFLDTRVNNEYHSNGQLSYTETIAILAPLFACTYDQSKIRIHPEGWQWIRIGKHEKYYDNGQLAWSLKYDDKGNLINSSKQYQKDGALIIY